VSDLRIDFDRLERAEARLLTVITDFEATSPVQADLVEAVGDGVASTAVRDFRDAWSIRREEYAGELRTLRDALGAIRETFAAIDAELVRRLDAITESVAEEGS